MSSSDKSRKEENARIAAKFGEAQERLNRETDALMKYVFQKIDELQIKQDQEKDMARSKSDANLTGSGAPPAPITHASSTAALPSRQSSAGDEERRPGGRLILPAY